MSINSRKPNGWRKWHGSRKPAPSLNFKEEKLDGEQNVVLIFNDKKQLVANKIILVNSCLYFDKLLNGNFKEANEKYINIDLGSFQFSSAKTLITYAHTKELDLKSNTLIGYVDLLELTHLWFYEDLFKLTAKCLEHFVCFDTVPMLYELAQRYSINELRDKCLELCENIDSKNHPIHEFFGY